MSESYVKTPDLSAILNVYYYEKLAVSVDKKVVDWNIQVRQLSQGANFGERSRNCVKGGIETVENCVNILDRNRLDSVGKSEWKSMDKVIVKIDGVNYWDAEIGNDGIWGILECLFSDFKLSQTVY